METLLITGGAGFIGSNFVRLVIETTEAHVVVLDKLTYAGNLQSLADVAHNPRFRFVHGDIVDPVVVGEVHREFSPDAVVNFAAESHVDRAIEGPEIFLQTNVMGTFQLLEASRHQLASMDDAQRAAYRFLHVSTDEVYGSLGKTGAFREVTPYAPNSPYSASKAGADHLVRAYQHTYGVPTLITNCSNNYGPYQFPEKLIPLVILNALEGKPLPIYGDGSNVRDWLYVVDHCQGILDVLQRGLVGEKYNIGGGNERTNLQIVDSICAELERQRPATENPALTSKDIDSYDGLKSFVTDRPGHDRRYAIDATKIRDALGWRPRHDLERGLASTIAWYLEHSDWCEAIQSGSYRRERLGLLPNED